MIPIARPDIGEEEVAAVTEVLRSGMIAQGRRVAELEERWADRVGTRHAIAVGNGTIALMAILAGLELGPGDEVITVGHTFAATANAILSTGATPVFVDIEPDTYLIDAKRIERAITSRTRALLPVHLFGLVADMDMVRAIGDRYGLAVVEDAAQAHGATFRDRAAGSFGHGAFSLYATKNMTTGEGGFITTDDDGLADWLRLYRNQGMRSRYQFEILGYNLRLTDIAAAIGLAQLDKLDRNTARRQTIAAAYDDAFADLPVLTPVTPVGRIHVFHQYTLGVGDGRDAILDSLRGAGVGADVYYPLPVHRQAYIQERGLHADLPVTDHVAATTLSLPMFPGLTDEEQATVIRAVGDAVERHGGITPDSPAPPGSGPLRAGSGGPEAAVRATTATTASAAAGEPASR
ncbi:MAG: DegT/DnrJ/EryC1/StrS aminotransferase family protein [Chloroflexi bacterium]|nr:DegT/DnrJ/EryC1/StrS aminotransferase family protein [Chloroflexota bacterium]